MRIVAIDPLTVLSGTEAEVLEQLLHDDMVRRNFSCDQQHFVAYRVFDRLGARLIVAPAGDELTVGKTVIVAGAEWVVQHASTERPETVEVRLAEALIPHHLDI